MASEQVERHLYNLRYDIYREATYSKKGNLIRPEKLLWHKTLKTWNTVFAICTEKIYNYNKKIIGYILEDFNGNTIKVEPRELKIAMALNKIDVVNLCLSFNDEGNVDKLIEMRIYEVNSFEELNKVIEDINRYEHYVIGNNKIGYFEICNTTLVDYKGYCNEIWLPNRKYMSTYFLSFNDYVNIVHIPNTYEQIEMGMGYGAKVLTDIYFDFDADKLINISLSSCYRDMEPYRRLQDSEDIKIHVLHFNLSAKDFFDMMYQRKDLTVQLKIRQSNIDSNDPLQKFILKSKVLGTDIFEIDFTNRKLVEAKLKSNVDILKLPPVNKLKFRWFNEDVHIGTLYLPETLDSDTLSLSSIPNKEFNNYNPATRSWDSRFEKRVNKVVIPKECKVKFIVGGADKLGIIFETANGVGTADKVAVSTPNKGIKLLVVDIIKYPSILLKNGGKTPECTNVIIQDANKNRKSVNSDVLIDKVMEGTVQLINADILLNRTIRIRE